MPLLFSEMLGLGLGLGVLLLTTHSYSFGFLKPHTSHTPSLVRNKFATSIQPLYLGFDDIIDNDADLLEQLRQQLQLSSLSQLRSRPSGSSNPREISNHIKAFFLLKKRGPEETVSFKQYLQDCKDSLDIINAISILDGITRLGIPIKDIIEWDAVEAAMGKFNFMVSSTLVSKAFAALGHLRLDEPKTKKYMKLLWAAVKYSKVTLTPTEVCVCLYQLQSVRISSYSADLNNFLAYFSSCLDSTKGIKCV